MTHEELQNKLSRATEERDQLRAAFTALVDVIGQNNGFHELCDRECTRVVYRGNAHHSPFLLPVQHSRSCKSPDAPKRVYVIDLPNPEDPEAPMVTYDRYRTGREALEAAKKYFGADDQGRISIISELPVEEGE